MAEETIRIGLTYDQKGEQQAVKGMANVANAAGKASDAVKSFSHKMADQDAYSRFNSQMNNIEKSMGRLSSAGSSLSGALKTLYATMAAYGALRIASAFLETASSLERMQMLLMQVTGNAVAAEKAFKWISELGAKAFGIDAISDSFVKLQSVGIDPTTGSLKAIVDALSAFGKTSASELSEATVAIQQMAGKGVISMEELRQQLAEKIPTAAVIMARELGMSVAEMTDKISKGALDAQTGLNALFAGLSKDYGGMAEKAANTWGGMVNQLRAQYMLFQKDVMDSGPFDFLKEQLASFVTKLQELRKAGILDQWARDVAVAVIDAFSAMVQAAELFIQTLNNVKTVWIGIKNISAQVNMNKLIAERDAIVSRLDEGFWNKFVFGSVGSEESQKLKTRLKEITAEMGVYSQEMVDNANAVQSLAQKNQQITSSFDTIKGSLNKATKAATEHSAALDPERVRLESVAGSVKKLGNALSGNEGLDKKTKAAQKAVDELDADKALTSFTSKVQDLTYSFNEMAAAARTGFDFELWSIDAKAQKSIDQYKEGVKDLELQIATLEEKISKAKIVDPTATSALTQMKKQYDLISESVADYEKNTLKAAEAQKALKLAERAVSVAELKAEYVELTGTIEQQIDAVIALYQAKIKAAQVDTNLTDEQKAIQTQIYNYKIYYAQLEKTGSLTDGLTEGFRKLYSQQKTSFQLGVQLANDLNDAIGGVFESVIAGERDIEEAFADMADAILAAIAKIAAQEIVIPVILQTVGLTGITTSGTSGASSNLSTALKDTTSTLASGGTTTSSSSYLGLTSIGDLFNFEFGESIDKLGNWIKASDSTTLKSLGGWINDNSALLGKISYGIGGLVSVGTGISDLLKGNYVTGAGSTIGGGLMIAGAMSGIPALAGIGAAVSLLSNVLGPLIDDLFKADKQMTLTMGTVQTSKGLLFKLGDTGLESDVVDPFVDSLADYLKEWEKAFDVSWTKAINDLGVNWSMNISQEDLENLTSEEIVGKMTNSILRAYAGQLAKQAFDIDRFNMTFLEGATGTGAFDWDYGELNETVSEIFGYFQVLEDAGVEVGDWFNKLSVLFNNDDMATGEFFQALQTSEESIGETMGRVIEGLSVIPNSIEQMSLLMDGIDLNLLATFEDDMATLFSPDQIEWIFQNIANQLADGFSAEQVANYINGALTSGGFDQMAKDMVSYIVQAMADAMGEGMSAADAYDYLENVYDFAKTIFETPLDEALADAVENQDFDSFKETFASSLQDTLIDVISEVFTSDMLNEIISSTFNTTGGMYKLIEDYIAGDIDAESFVTQFSNLADIVSEKLAAIWPTIEEMIGLINDKLGTAGDTANKTAKDYEDYYQSLIDTANGVQDLSDSMSQLNDWFEEQYYALVDLAKGGEDVTNAMTLLWDAYVAQLKSVYDEIMSDWNDIIDDNTMDEYQQRLKDLNDSYDKTIRELQVLEDAGIDTSVAVARLTEAYNYQYQAIVDDLLGAIYDTSQAMKTFAYDIENTIADILGTESSYLDVASTAWEGFWESMNKFDDLGDIDYLNDALDWLDKYYSSMQNAIKAKYQAEIDDLNTLRDSTEAYYEDQISALNTLRDSTDAYYQDQIDALKDQRDAIESQYDDQIDALNDYRDQVEETYGAQIDALQEQLDLAEEWADVLDSVNDQIKDMLQTTTNPADVFERLSIAGGEVDRLRALYEGSSGSERAAYAQDLMDAISDYMDLLGEAYQRPSNDYQQQYDAMLALLESIQSDAIANGGDTDSINQQIADLTAEQNALLADIDEQIASLEAAQTAALEAIDDQISSLENAQTAALEAIDDQISALEDAETSALAGIDSQIDALNDAMDADLEALDQTIVDYYNWLKSLGLDTYEATLTDLNASLALILEQSKTQTAYDNYYQNESVAWYRAIHGSTYDTSLGVGFMIKQLDDIYNRLGSVASYDVGTSFVPETGLALVHKGEAIIPANLINGGTTREGSSGISVTIGNVTIGQGTNARKAAKEFKDELVYQLKYDKDIKNLLVGR